MRIHKALIRIGFISVLMLAALAAASACELVFKLKSETGDILRVLPGSTVELKLGEAYTLLVEFTEDHRNCQYPPEDTLFTMNDSRWRVAREDQGLVLTAPIEWVQKTRSLNTVEIEMKATSNGEFVLGILRECPKGGYDERITFLVR